VCTWIRDNCRRIRRCERINAAVYGSRLPTGVFTPTTRWNCRQLVANSCTHRRRDETRQFRLVGVGGVYWALHLLWLWIFMYSYGWSSAIQHMCQISLLFRGQRQNCHSETLQMVIARPWLKIPFPEYGNQTDISDREYSGNFSLVREKWWFAFDVLPQLW